MQEKHQNEEPNDWGDGIKTQKNSRYNTLRTEQPAGTQVEGGEAGEEINQIHTEEPQEFQIIYLIIPRLSTHPYINFRAS